MAVYGILKQALILFYSAFILALVSLSNKLANSHLTMKKAILFVVCLALGWACGNTAQNADGQESTTASEETAATQEVAAPDGEKIYKQYCVVCHGIAGDMGASGAFNLTETELSIEEKMVVITNGRNTMTAFGSLLEEDEIKAVAEYTEKLKAD